MKRLLVAFALSIGSASAAQAVPVTVSGNALFNSIVTNNDQTSFTSVPILVSSGGMSATIQITLVSLAGQEFLKLDGNTRLGIGDTSPDGFHVDLGNINNDSDPTNEDVRFDVKLLSKSANVGKVGFNISSIGIRNCCGDPTVSWTSNVSVAPVVNSGLLPTQTEVAVPMDSASAFHALTSSDYSGTLLILANQLQ